MNKYSGDVAAHRAPDRLDRQGVATTPQGDADRGHQLRRRDDVPQSEYTVRILTMFYGFQNSI